MERTQPMSRPAWLRPRFASVRARTTAVAVLLVALVLAVWGASLVVFVGRSLDDRLDAGAVVGKVAGQVAGGQLPATLAGPGEEADDGFVQVVDDNGRVVAASQNLAGQPPVTDERPEAGKDLRLVLESVPPVDLDDRFRLVGVRVTGPNGPVTIFVGTEWEHVEESVDTLSRALRLGAPGLLLLSAALVWWLVGRALRPVESIRAQVAEITATELSRRVSEPATADEIGRLARTMNDMLDRLETATERQRRFVADASHELRGPLAIARAQLEIAAAHPEAVDMESTVGALLRDNQRMERLVSDLLFLARRDERRADPASEPVALDMIVLDEAARPRRVPIDVSAVAAVPLVGGRADDLVRVVANLLDNAERHARSQVRLELRSRAGEGLVELAVADDGTGVPEARREDIFERFARLDEARSRDDGGSGLGLAIVRDIVSTHGGTVEVADAPGGGARFLVRLPACVAVSTAGGQPPVGSRR